MTISALTALWPNPVLQSATLVAAAWEELSQAERNAAVERAPAFLELCRTHDKRPPPLHIYLRDKHRFMWPDAAVPA